MQTNVEIREIGSLKEFQEFLKPIVQNNNANSKSKVNSPGKFSINVDPDLFVTIASDEFINNLPSEFLKETDELNVALYSRRRVEIGKQIPIPVVISTLKNMKAVIVC